ncbi:MAG: hydrolase [Oscillospiraceae bacterium]|nr:hydrolase [Oscillospiraceae bacterium]
MIKAIGSRKRAVRKPDGSYQTFLSLIADLLDAEPVQRLDAFPHHADSSRLQHSVNVAYYSFLLCRQLGLDYRSAARGGLLHDLFFYDLANKKDGPQHTWLHPEIALQNAEEVAELCDRERDIILCHMWPRAHLPRYLESFVVSLMDKVAFFTEVGRTVFVNHKSPRRSNTPVSVRI